MSRYEVDFTPTAQKELDRLPKKEIARIVEATQRLAEDPRPHGSKKLVGEENLYRIRVGKYRAVYAIFDDKLVVLIVRVRHRKNAYD